MLRNVIAIALLTGTAYASAPSKHEVWTRAAIDALPTFHEDRDVVGKSTQLDAVALAVAGASADAPRPPREWAALMLTVGFHESSFSLRIIANECRRHECDGGRARGAWQNHRNALNASLWDAAPGNLSAQTAMAHDALRRAYWTCARSGVPWVQGTLNAYAGRRCSAHWPGLDKRLATFNRLVAR